VSEEKSLLTKIVKNTQGNSVQWGKEHPQYLGTIMFVFLCIFLLVTPHRKRTFTWISFLFLTINIGSAKSSTDSVGGKKGGGVMG
jgi:hypothetical protein